MSGTFRLLARLETGKLGELLRARALGSDEEVEIRRFSVLASERSYAEALAQEAARAVEMGHPGIASPAWMGFAAGRFCAGRPLQRALKLSEVLKRLSNRVVAMPPALALYLVAEAAEILAAAHARKGCHGALTPANLLLREDGRLQIRDFGALRALAASPELRRMADLGRQFYREPELARRGEADAKSDVYSLGAIAYELLTFRSVAQARQGAMSTRRDPLLAPSRVDRRLSGRIDAPLMRALDAERSRRFSSAAELAAALRSLFDTLGFAPTVEDSARFYAELVAKGGLLESGQEIPAEELAVEERLFPAVAGPHPEPLAPASPVEGVAPLAAPASAMDWEAPPGPMPDAARVGSAPKAAKGARTLPDAPPMRLPVSVVAPSNPAEPREAEPGPRQAVEPSNNEEQTFSTARKPVERPGGRRAVLAVLAIGLALVAAFVFGLRVPKREGSHRDRYTPSTKRQHRRDRPAAGVH